MRIRSKWEKAQRAALSRTDAASAHAANASVARSHSAEFSRTSSRMLVIRRVLVSLPLADRRRRPPPIKLL